MNKEKKTYTGINIQWPISELILSGEKTVETRTYPIPKNYLGVEMILIETPGKLGKFKSRMRAIVVFKKCFKYSNKIEFYKDIERHCVTPKSDWAWDPEKGKWGWVLEVKKVFTTPLPLIQKTGIRYSKNIIL